jgi:hypothetical protein
MKEAPAVPTGFVGLGIPKIGLWQSWRVTGSRAGGRNLEGRAAVAEARQIGVSHIHSFRANLLNRWPDMEMFDRSTAATLGAAVARSCVLGERKVLVPAIGGLRMILDSDFFWIEANARGQTYDVALHQLPQDLRQASDAFAQVTRRARLTSRIAAE